MSVLHVTVNVLTVFPLTVTFFLPYISYGSQQVLAGDVLSGQPLCQRKVATVGGTFTCLARVIG